MRVVIGLGNPGEEYARSRHNLGFLVLDALAARLGWRWRRESPLYLVAEGAWTGQPVALLKPLTFMNRSGEAWAGWAARAGVPAAGTSAPAGPAAPGAAPAGPPAAEPVGAAPRAAGTPQAGQAPAPLVVCDDIALPLGTLRIRARGGAGGHRGLESLLAVWGGEDLPRLRLGCAGGAGVAPPDWADYVLSPFPPAEWEEARAMARRAAEAALAVLEAGPETAAARFNGPAPAA